jgi:membrane protease YdiL (CAAX protease family)
LSIIFASVINIIVPFINEALFDTDLNYYWLFALSSRPIFFMILSVAVMPAIAEELAFRGFILNNLMHFSNKQTALIVSSFLFALLHLDFISFFWLFPFALLLGWLRLQYDTMWYGILAHFIFNTTTCIFSLYEAGVF